MIVRRHPDLHYVHLGQAVVRPIYVTADGREVVFTLRSDEREGRIRRASVHEISAEAERCRWQPPVFR